MREVDRLIKEGFTHVVDADLESYFDTIPHERLMARIEERIIDGQVLDLIRGWLKADILKGLERWTPTGGTPQGAVISPLLANIYLHRLDKLMAARGFRMVRYADDFVVLCKSREEADAALAAIGAWVTENGLRLHATRRMSATAGCRERVRVPRLPVRGRPALVRKKSLTRLKDSDPGEDATQAGRQPRRIIADLNRSLRGWFGYFKHAHPHASNPSTDRSGVGCDPCC